MVRIGRLVFLPPAALLRPAPSHPLRGSGGGISTGAGAVHGSPPSDAQARPQAARLLLAAPLRHEADAKISCSKGERNGRLHRGGHKSRKHFERGGKRRGGRLGANHRRQRVGRTAARARRNQVIDRLMQFFRRALDSFQVVTQRSRYRLLDCDGSAAIPLSLQWVGPKCDYWNVREVLSTPHRAQVSARAVAGRQLTVDS